MFSAADGLRACPDGCQRVMYARGAMHNPAVFAEHQALCRNETPAPPDAVRLRAMTGGIWTLRASTAGQSRAVENAFRGAPLRARPARRAGLASTALPMY